MAVELNEKQKRFVAEYLIDLNATQAAIRAGYSEETAYSQGQRLLKHVEVAQEIDAKRKRLAFKTEINQEWVLNNLKNVAERCMQAQEVLNREGEPTGEYKFDSSGANKSLELIGKHLGMFSENHKHQHFDMSKCTDEQLRAIASGKSVS